MVVYHGSTFTGRMVILACLELSSARRSKLAVSRGTESSTETGKLIATELLDIGPRCNAFASGHETCTGGEIVPLNDVSMTSGSLEERINCAISCRRVAANARANVCCLAAPKKCSAHIKGSIAPGDGFATLCLPAQAAPQHPHAAHKELADPNANFLTEKALQRASAASSYLFRDINPRTIQQGSVGDCWLVSTIASLANYPEAVHKLFEQHFRSDNGFYDMKLYDLKTGKWVRIVVDDTIAVGNGILQLRDGSHGKQFKYMKIGFAGGFWPQLLEKAFAKLMGGYPQLGHGDNAYAMDTLTGPRQVSTVYEWKDSDRRNMGWTNFRFVPGKDGKRARSYSRGALLGLEQIWTRVWAGKVGHRLMSASCCKTTVQGGKTGEKGFSGEALMESGLFNNHAYSLLEVKDFRPNTPAPICKRLSDGRIVNDAMCDQPDFSSMYSKSTVPINSITERLRLCKVRNPWGDHKKFTGAWSDANRSTWAKHPDIHAAVGLQPVPDGTWWMTFEELERVMRKIYIGEVDMVAFNPPQPEGELGAIEVVPQGQLGKPVVPIKPGAVKPEVVVPVVPLNPAGPVKPKPIAPPAGWKPWTPPAQPNNAGVVKPAVVGPAQPYNAGAVNPGSAPTQPMPTPGGGQCGHDEVLHKGKCIKCNAGWRADPTHKYCVK